MRALLAAAPIAVVLLLMAGLRTSAAVAGVAGSITALAVALIAFDLAASAEISVSQTEATAGILLEAIHSAAVILWIIFPALAIYELQQRTGAVGRIRDTLVGLTDDRRMQAVLIAWFFGLFMEGAAGFGTPVALAAPLLVGIGFDPVRAVALALIGHAAGVSFGAVGTPVFAQAEITGFVPQEIGAATALLHTILGMILLAFLVGIGGETRPTARDAAWAALAGACFLVPFLAIAAFAGPELPTLGGALLGAVVFVTVLRRRRPPPADVDLDLRHLLRDLAPYMATLVLVLATRLIPPLRDFLSGITVDWAFRQTYAGSFEPLYHPGTLLLLGVLAGAVATQRTSHLAPAAMAAVNRLVPVAVALIAMLSMAKLMVHSGMIELLAEEAARIGSAWPLLAPAVGVLGTFVTGSATASNILFSEFQLTTATALSLPALLMLAAQGFGAAVGNIIAPHNIITGAATVGLRGREGEILVRTAVACAIYAAAGGAALLAFTALVQP